MPDIIQCLSILSHVHDADAAEPSALEYAGTLFRNRAELCAGLISGWACAGDAGPDDDIATADLVDTVTELVECGWLDDYTWIEPGEILDELIALRRQVALRAALAHLSYGMDLGDYDHPVIVGYLAAEARSETPEGDPGKQAAALRDAGWLDEWLVEPNDGVGHDAAEYMAAISPHHCRGQAGIAITALLGTGLIDSPACLRDIGAEALCPVLDAGWKADDEWRARRIDETT